jgi:hypothetical protein
MNKVSHLYSVAAAGANFIVLPLHFAAAHEHPKSKAWEATVGPRAHPAHTMRVAALYRRFKAELPLQDFCTISPPGPPDRPVSTAPPALPGSALAAASQSRLASNKRPAGAPVDVSVDASLNVSKDMSGEVSLDMSTDATGDVSTDVSLDVSRDAVWDGAAGKRRRREAIIAPRVPRSERRCRNRAQAIACHC